MSMSFEEEPEMTRQSLRARGHLVFLKVIAELLAISKTEPFVGTAEMVSNVRAFASSIWEPHLANILMFLKVISVIGCSMSPLISIERSVFPTVMFSTWILRKRGMAPTPLMKEFS